MAYRIGLANRLGNRASNQDRCTARRRDDTALLVLADGMGGHARGDLAAQIVIDSVADAFDAAPLPIQQPGEFLRGAIEAAHHDVYDRGIRQEPPVYPRTTVVACIVQQMRVWWAHVGDSRLYLIRDGTPIARTRDHTYVEDLYQREAISEREMLSHPLRNYVIYCLGGSSKTPPVTVSAEQGLQFGDVVLLCSDGLWSAVADREFVALINCDDLAGTANRLTEAAERAAYPHCDNVSVAALCVLADLEVDPGEHEPPVPDQAEKPHAPAEEDALDEAITRIHDALHRYRHELGD